MNKLLATAAVLALGASASFSQTAATPAAPGTLTSTNLAALDKNGDGAVTKEELIAVMDAAFAQLDTDRDGYVSSAEGTAYIAPDRFAAANANDDGRLSKTEFMTAVVEDFNAADRDGDGVLN